MQTRLFTLGLGAVYLLVGVIGFIPALYTSPPAGAPHVDVTASYGYLFGVFPVNAIHDAFHIVVGLVAILVSASFNASRYLCRILFVVFGLLTVAGFMPHANTLWGLMPLFTNDTWLHAGTCLSAALFGFVASEENVPVLESH